MTDRDWIQIEQAGKGCISGQLKEWPVLRGALWRLDIDIKPDTFSNPTVRNICKLMYHLGREKVEYLLGGGL